MNSSSRLVASSPHASSRHNHRSASLHAAPCLVPSTIVPSTIIPSSSVIVVIHRIGQHHTTNKTGADTKCGTASHAHPASTRPLRPSILLTISTATVPTTIPHLLLRVSSITHLLLRVPTATVLLLRVPASAIPLLHRATPARATELTGELAEEAALLLLARREVLAVRRLLLSVLTLLPVRTR